MVYMLVLGASSDMARSCVIEFAKLGWSFHLAGRDVECLEAVARDLRIRTKAEIDVSSFDCLKPDEQILLWDKVKDDTQAVLCAAGMLGDQERARHDPKYASLIITTNFTGLVPILSLAADTFYERKQGALMVISSVAGNRGRSSNYVYGSAKAGLSAFLSGLRQRLSNHGVQVITVLPGFVETKMTDGMQLPAALTASPSDVARDIIMAFQKRRSIIYTRFYWRFIMLIVKMVPEFIFKRLEKF